MRGTWGTRLSCFVENGELRFVVYPGPQMRGTWGTLGSCLVENGELRFVVSLVPKCVGPGAPGTRQII